LNRARLRTRRIDTRHGLVDMSHGAGGRASAQLIQQIFIDAFDNPALARADDQAAFDLPAGRVVMSTDGYVISPLFFPGGDIGSLAVHGTINDIAMAGAIPLHLAAARQSGVTIVTGDTKVVERGHGDGVFITTTGIGLVPHGLLLSASRASPGDHVILSGSLGDHGVAIMSKRANLDFETELLSDSAALHGLVAVMVRAAGSALHAMRDPTRGGLASALNEIAQTAGVGIMLDEEAIPVRPEVSGACELLGLDPLYVANEGKLVAIVAPEASAILVSAMRRHPLGSGAALIGEVVADEDCFVQMTTSFGGGRIVDWLSGEQLPRIC
jgi:hydrogenase expression/formation protein HypE